MTNSSTRTALKPVRHFFYTTRYFRLRVFGWSCILKTVIHFLAEKDFNVAIIAWIIYNIDNLWPQFPWPVFSILFQNYSVTNIMSVWYYMSHKRISFDSVKFFWKIKWKKSSENVHGIDLFLIVKLLLSRSEVWIPGLCGFFW